MAKFLKGIHGAYTGKVGNVVGSSWRNVDVKSLRKQRNPCYSCNNKKRFLCDRGTTSRRKKRYSMKIIVEQRQPVLIIIRMPPPILIKMPPLIS